MTQSVALGPVVQNVSVPSSPAAVFAALRAMIHDRVPDGAKTDLRDSTLVRKYQQGVCGDHGIVTPIEGKRCWCGDKIILVAELRRIVEREIVASTANDPCWRC